MNILVVVDNDWDNFSIVHKRFGSIPHSCNINFCYGPKMQAISNMCSQHMLHLFRRSLVEDKLKESMNEIVKTIPTLDKLLKDLMDNTGSYRYKQSLLINYIGSHIIKKTKYPSKAQQEIFSFVSFFHNIALSKDKYAQIHSDQELKESDLSQEEKELITKHAILAAKLVSDSANKIPYEAAIILKQHHGSSRGLGLSNLTASISPLAIIFLFAQEWTNIVLMYQNDEKRPNKKEIIKMLQKKYPLQGFHNIISTLDTLEL